MEQILPKDLDLDDSVYRINKLLDKAEKDAVKREAASNNINGKLTIDNVIRCAIESLGVASGAASKNRHELVKSECLDLIYCIILLYIKSDKLLSDI